MKLQLQNWSVRSRPWGAIESPEQEGICLYGLVIGHPLHRDGKQVLTSPVTLRYGDRVVTRSGSEYDLADPDSEYERLFPRARQRLLARLEACSPQPPMLVDAPA